MLVRAVWVGIFVVTGLILRPSILRCVLLRSETGNFIGLFGPWNVWYPFHHPPQFFLRESRSAPPHGGNKEYAEDATRELA
jgi:hypothetical protein